MNNKVSSNSMGQQRGSSRLLPHFLMLITATLVSTSFTVGAAITGSVDPAILTLVRFVMAAVMFAPWIAWRYSLRCSWSLFGRCALISSCLVAFFCCMFWALRYTTPLNTSVIFALVPSFSGIYALFLVRERLRTGQLVALGCGLAGVVWVIFRGDLSLLFSMQWNRGDLIFLFGCLGMGLYTPLVRLLHRGESMAVMTFWVLVSGVCWLLPLAGYKLSGVDWAAIPSTVWLGIAYLALFTTIVTFFLTQYCVMFLGPTRVMAYSYLYPGLVLLIDLALGRGLPPGSVLFGVVVILLAMFVLQRSGGEKAGS